MCSSDLSRFKHRGQVVVGGRAPSSRLSPSGDQFNTKVAGIRTHALSLFIGWDDVPSRDLIRVHVGPRRGLGGVNGLPCCRLTVVHRRPRHGLSVVDILPVCGLAVINKFPVEPR